MLLVVAVGCQTQPDESSIRQEVISILPGTHDFGDQQIGSTSAAYRVTVSPGPLNQADTVTAVTTNCPDFMVAAPGLPATVRRECTVTCTNQVCPAPDVRCETTLLETYSFDAFFQPRVPGPVSCVVTVTTQNAANSKTITLSGNGVAPAIAVDVRPGSIEFGDVRRNADSTRARVDIRSIGSQALNVTSVQTSTGFTLQGATGGYRLAPNDVQSYDIACHPTAVGQMAGQLMVVSDDPTQGRVAVDLSCKGIDSDLDITPSPLVLRTTRVGEPVDAMIDLHNSGAAPMTLENITINAPGLTMTTVPLPGTMLAGTTGVAHVGLRFAAATPGDVNGTLVATYDGGQTRTTQVTGRALATSMALTPDGEVDLGPVCIGQVRAQPFTVIANDQGSFTLAGVTDPGAPFSISMPALPAAVLGGGANQIKFNVSAAPTEPGLVTTPVTLHTDIPRGKDHAFNLSVRGLPPGVTATPASIDLGSHDINTTEVGQEIHLSNCNMAPIAISNVRIEGIDAVDFSIVSPAPPPMLPPRGRATWLLVLNAHTVGPKEATFLVDYDDGMKTGTAMVELSGEGLGPHIEDQERGSYYACSTGRPTALWPLALALLLLRRRRR